MAMESHRFSPVILREYDIRGVVGDDLKQEDALALGRAFGTMVRRVGGRNIVVGYDGRTHSPMLEESLVKGLVSTGLEVVRIGLGPTPMLYFAAFEGDADAGIMVTGSHNAADQNGFKMLIAKRLPGGGPIYGDAIQTLASLAAAGDFEEGQGRGTDKNVEDSYIARLLKDYQGTRGLKVVWDNGNGAAGNVLAKLTAQLPGEHIILYKEVDGHFPNHHPDPTVAKNLVDLQKAVAKHGADLGIGLDGDADRIGAIDSKGRIVAGDQLLALFAREVLRDHPGATIISEVKASQALFDDIKEHGGKPLMWKTGHSLIKVKMAETHSPLAGEMSGHVFFADKYYGYDDGIYSGVRLLSLLERFGTSLAALRDSLPDCINTPEIRFAVEESKKFAIVKAVKESLQRQGADVNTTDGVRVTTPEGWWLLRASNTGAVLVARAEAHNEVGLAMLKAQVGHALKDAGFVPPDF